MEAGVDPGIFLGGGAPLRNGVTNSNKPRFFCRIPVVLESRRSSQGGVLTPCTLPLDLPLRCTPFSSSVVKNALKLVKRFNCSIFFVVQF